MQRIVAPLFVLILIGCAREEPGQPEPIGPKPRAEMPAPQPKPEPVRPNPGPPKPVVKPEPKKPAGPPESKYRRVHVADFHNKGAAWQREKIEVAGFFVAGSGNSLVLTSEDGSLAVQCGIAGDPAWLDKEYAKLRLRQAVLIRGVVHLPREPAGPPPGRAPTFGSREAANIIARSKMPRLGVMLTHGEVIWVWR